MKPTETKHFEPRPTADADANPSLIVGVVKVTKHILDSVQVTIGWIINGLINKRSRSLLPINHRTARFSIKGRDLNF